jgi:DNA-binding XRE family transcriptional regulator
MKEIIINNFRLVPHTIKSYKVYFTYHGEERFIGYCNCSFPKIEDLLGNTIGNYDDVIRRWETSVNERRVQIGRQLAELRNKRGLSTRQLADICGVTYVNISKIENGRYNVSIDILNKVCDALDADIRIIDKEEEDGKA